METLDKIEYPFSFRWGQEIKFIDGKYKGFNAVVRWCGNTTLSAEIKIEGVGSEVVEETRYAQDLQSYNAAQKSLRSD